MQQDLAQHVPPGLLQSPIEQCESILRTGFYPESLRSWESRMATARRCVGRIEIPVNTDMGTGFLVGPDMLLTNWHVARAIEDATIVGTTCGIRFLGADAGEFVCFSNDWKIDFSPEGELDFALIRIQKRRRDWLVIPKKPVGDPPALIILQHPQGRDLSIAMGTVAGKMDKPPRLYHNVDTDQGSSGAPVFNSKWELVAIHRAGGPAANAGVPIDLIRERVARYLLITSSTGAAIEQQYNGQSNPVRDLKEMHNWLHERQLELLKQLRPLCARFPKDSSVRELQSHLESLQRRLLRFDELRNTADVAAILYVGLRSDWQEIEQALQDALVRRCADPLADAVVLLDRVLGQTMPAVNGAIARSASERGGAIAKCIEYHNKCQAIDNDLRFVSQSLENSPLHSVGPNLRRLCRKLIELTAEAPDGDLWASHMSSAVARLKDAIVSADRDSVSREFIEVVHLADEQFCGADKRLLQECERSTGAVQ